jgi:hypothetical protein
VPNYQDLATSANHLAAKRDKQNLRTLRERLPGWLVEEEIAEQVDANETASADIDVDTADMVT